ncbi:MAG: isoprenylcysteine carboxylmethyltransferase family protein [Promethearchaeota archaeon]|nr:MAG: isoprenylcysteine carboxylmethyltransferase family protein [Candidatus Lokiarchaeota archaeon]
MNEKDNTHDSREIPHSHLLQTLLPIIFIVIWILDSWILLLSVWLNEFVPSILRLILFITVLGLALIILFLSHKTLFEHNEPSDTLITSGILSRVRNPLYLGILLIYVAVLLLSISIISIILFIIILFVYNKMVNYEEKKLEKMFGNEYLEYKKKVPKWIPKLF